MDGRGLKIKHGMHGTRTYNSWRSMKHRCDTPTANAYDRYGGRGIGYDPTWESFENFFKDMGVRPKNTSLDREDNDGPYCKSNCRWATAQEQQDNRKCTVLLAHKGITKTPAQWSRDLGLDRHAVGRRLKAGWSFESRLVFRESVD